MFDPKTGHPITLSQAVPAEELITLKQAAASLPRRRAGRPTSVATLYRWTTRGCRGERLRYTQVGCTRCTTREWLDAFFDRLTEAGGAQDVSGGSAPNASPRTAAQRDRATTASGRELTAAGI